MSTSVKLAVADRKEYLLNTKNNKVWKKIWQNRALYVFVLPMFLYFVIFHIVPVYGLQIAFRDFTPVKGIMGSNWAGMKYIDKFISSYSFWTLLKNTLTISIYSLLVNTPLPIILALVINYLPSAKFKKLTQTITYAPHFISTVVIVGMMFVFMAPSSGIVNNVFQNLGLDYVDFMGDPNIFPHLYVWSGAWAGTGWSSIIYIATLAGVDPELHEAAIVDGANKLKRIWHIDIPSIMPTVVLLLILSCGRLMSVGYEKAFLMQTASNLSTSEIISTYVYKIGLQSVQYSYASAIGLFNNVINCIILLIANRFANKINNSGIW